MMFSMRVKAVAVVAITTGLIGGAVKTGEARSHASYDATSKCITITGPDNTLESVAKDVGNEKVFKHEPEYYRATCRADIALRGRLRVGKVGADGAYDPQRPCERLYVHDGRVLRIEKGGRLVAHGNLGQEGRMRARESENLLTELRFYYPDRQRKLSELDLKVIERGLVLMEGGELVLADARAVWCKALWLGGKYRIERCQMDQYKIMPTADPGSVFRDNCVSLPVINRREAVGFKDGKVRWRIERSSGWLEDQRGWRIGAASDAVRKIYLRFPIDLPRGAEVASARVSLMSSRPERTVIAVRRLKTTDCPGLWRVNPGKLPAAGEVKWKVKGAVKGKSKRYESDNLAPLVQEFIDGESYRPGAHIGLRLEGADNNPSVFWGVIGGFTTDSEREKKLNVRMVVEYLAPPAAAEGTKEVLVKGASGRPKTWRIMRKGVWKYEEAKIRPRKPRVTGTPPNPNGDTVIDRDTVWEGGTNVRCGGNIRIGNNTKKISVTFKDCTIAVKDDILIGDGKSTHAVKFVMQNSTVNWGSSESELILEWVPSNIGKSGSVLDISHSKFHKDVDYKESHPTTRALGLHLKSRERFIKVRPDPARHHFNTVRISDTVFENMGRNQMRHGRGPQNRYYGAIHMTSAKLNVGFNYTKDSYLRNLSFWNCETAILGCRHPQLVEPSLRIVQNIRITAPREVPQTEYGFGRPGGYSTLVGIMRFGGKGGLIKDFYSEVVGKPTAQPLPGTCIEEAELYGISAKSLGLHRPFIVVRNCRFHQIICDKGIASLWTRFENIEFLYSGVGDLVKNCMFRGGCCEGAPRYFGMGCDNASSTGNLFVDMRQGTLIGTLPGAARVRNIEKKSGIPSTGDSASFRILNDTFSNNIFWNLRPSGFWQNDVPGKRSSFLFHRVENLTAVNNTFDTISHPIIIYDVRGSRFERLSVLNPARKALILSKCANNTFRDSEISGEIHLAGENSNNRFVNVKYKKVTFADDKDVFDCYTYLTVVLEGGGDFKLEVLDADGEKPAKAASKRGRVERMEVKISSETRAGKTLLAPRKLVLTGLRAGRTYEVRTNKGPAEKIRADGQGRLTLTRSVSEPTEVVLKP